MHAAPGYLRWTCVALLALAGGVCSCKSADQKACEALNTQIERFKGDLDGASKKERVEIAKAHQKEVDAIELTDDHPARRARTLYANALKHLVESLEETVEAEEYKKKFGEESPTADNTKKYLKEFAKGVDEARRKVAKACEE